MDRILFLLVVCWPGKWNTKNLVHWWS